MTLQEILYGAFQPPEKKNGITHKIGFSSEPRYVEPKKTTHGSSRLVDGLNPSEYKVLKLLNMQTKPVSAVDLEKKLPWTRNHCSIILTSLYKKGMVNRVKVSQNGTRIYFYTAKDKI